MSIFLGKVHKVTGCNVKIYVERYKVDKKYKKSLKRTTRIMAHDELGVQEGQTVKIQLCAPISKLKKFRVIEVIK